MKKVYGWTIKFSEANQTWGVWHGEYLQIDFNLKSNATNWATTHDVSKAWKPKEETKQQTAVERYAELEKEAKVLVSELQQKLRTESKAFKNNSSNWGYVGNLAHIVNELKDLLGK
jgi:hypothetical protein